MVQLEQRGQLVGVLLVALQPLQQLQLALHQPLAAAGEVDEHARVLRPQAGLLGGQPQRLLLHRVERAGHLAHLVQRGDRHRLDRDGSGIVAPIPDPRDRIR